MNRLAAIPSDSETSLPNSRKASDSTTESSPHSDNGVSLIDQRETASAFNNKCGGTLFTRPMSMDELPTSFNYSKPSFVESKTRSKSTSSLYKPSLADFKIKKLLGVGAYSKVVLAEYVEQQTNYALKILDKDFLEKVKF